MKTTTVACSLLLAALAGVTNYSLGLLVGAGVALRERDYETLALRALGPWGERVVLASQLAFVVTAYSHAYLDSALTRNKFHISAVLDHDVRSTICACVGLAGLFSLVMLERCRALLRHRTQ